LALHFPQSYIFRCSRQREREGDRDTDNKKGKNNLRAIGREEI